MDFEFHFQLIRVILGYGLVAVAIVALLVAIYAVSASGK